MLLGVVGRPERQVAAARGTAISRRAACTTRRRSGSRRTGCPYADRTGRPASPTAPTPGSRTAGTRRPADAARRHERRGERRRRRARQRPLGEPSNGVPMPLTRTGSSRSGRHRRSAPCRRTSTAGRPGSGRRPGSSRGAAGTAAGRTVPVAAAGRPPRPSGRRTGCPRPRRRCTACRRACPCAPRGRPRPCRRASRASRRARAVGVARAPSDPAGHGVVARVPDDALVVAEHAELVRATRPRASTS